MISRVSLFNKGIYKSTVKRNLWGSALYFIILFLVTSMPLISNINNERIFERTVIGYSTPLIYQDQYMQFPILAAIAVPTVVAMLLYRFVHSKRTAVFVHGLPVGRTANYISTLAAAFTLMAVPVILNGLVLMGLCAAVYSQMYTIANCFVWIGMNIMCQFVMFSIATLAAMITGNTIATAGLNVLLHTFVIIIVGCFSVVSDNFLYGYVSDGNLLNMVINSNPAAWICSISTQLGHNYYSNTLALNANIGKIPWYIAAAAVLYAASWFLYKKRGMETAEDIAAFKVLNPVYKYFVTFIGTLAVYAIFNTFFSENPVIFFAVVLVLSVVIYFACEMLLKKTFRVWGSYKGYLCFGGAFAVIICIFAFTSFFGYETRVPAVEDIEKAAVYNYYYRSDEPYVGNSDIIEYAVDNHSRLIEQRGIIDNDNDYTRVHFKYQLKNGKTIYRVYNVSPDTNKAIMAGLYQNDDYVTANEAIFRDDKLLRVVFDEGSKIYIPDLNKAAEFVECVRKDVLALEYNQMYINHNYWNIGFEIQYEMTREPVDGPVETVASSYIHDGMVLPESSYIDYEHFNINANYTNTINWLRNNGYEQLLKLDIDSPVHIVDCSGITDKATAQKSIYEYVNSGKEIALIQDAEKIDALEQLMVSMPVADEIGKEYDYVIYREAYDSQYSDTQTMEPVIIAQTDKENADKLLTALAVQ